MLPNMKKNADGGVTLYIQKDSPARTSKPTGCPRRTTSSTSSCASIVMRPVGGNLLITMVVAEMFFYAPDVPPDPTVSPKDNGSD